MGKGDIKTRRGKIFAGTYGVTRKRKTKKAVVIPVKKEEKPVEKKTTAKKTATKKTTAKKTTTKTTAKKTTTKKTTTTKKASTKTKKEA
jgi:ribosomal small subunit protein bTHX